MFIQTWKKYLPAIVILLKRSAKGEQKLGMNHTDFERAASGRKIKLTFNTIELNDGRMDNTVKHSPVAKDLVQVLLENDATRPMVRGQNLSFALNNSFELIIKNNTPVRESDIEEGHDTSSTEPSPGSVEMQG